MLQSTEIIFSLLPQTILLLLEFAFYRGGNFSSRRANNLPERPKLIGARSMPVLPIAFPNLNKSLRGTCFQKDMY